MSMGKNDHKTRPRIPMNRCAPRCSALRACACDCECDTVIRLHMILSLLLPHLELRPEHNALLGAKFATHSTRRCTRPISTCSVLCNDELANPASRIDIAVPRIHMLKLVRLLLSSGSTDGSLRLQLHHPLAHARLQRRPVRPSTVQSSPICSPGHGPRPAHIIPCSRLPDSLAMIS